MPPPGEKRPTADSDAQVEINKDLGPDLEDKGIGGGSKPDTEDKATGGSPPPRPDPGVKPPHPIYVNYDKERYDAANKIAGYYKKKIVRSREKAFKNEGGVLFCKKMRKNVRLEAIEVMCLYVIHDQDYRC